MKRMVVLGATSEIAIATLVEFARVEPWHFILCGRNLDALHKLAAMPELSSCKCEVMHFDTAMTAAEQESLWQMCIEMGASDSSCKSSSGSSCKSTSGSCSCGAGVDALYCAVGYLGNQEVAEKDVAECELIMQANFNGLLPILTFAGQYFKQRKAGSIMVISSVAGERGRCSNYCYGSSKAAMTAFLSGMRCSLLRSNVHVMTIKPGYVATRMVAHKKLPPYITASVQTVAKDIVRGYQRRSSVVYTMWLWRYIMAVVRLIPESIFKHLHMF